jgi:predicted RNase H-like HicB family nuclease
MRQVIIEPAEEGGYIASVPSLPGCYSQGDTWQEVISNVREAIELYIEDLIENGEEVPEDHFERVLVVV